MARVDELRRCRRRVSFDLLLKTDKYWVSRGHLKDEGYMEEKVPRPIMPRSDEYLAWMGPLFHAFEQQVKQFPFLVKGLSTEARAAELQRVFGAEGTWILCGDFESMESSHGKEVVKRVWRQAFYAVFKGVLTPRQLDKMIKRYSGKNTLKFRGVTVVIVARLLSAEPFTSSMNALLNLFLITFCLREEGQPWLKPPLKVEGDDNILKVATRLLFTAMAPLGFVFKVKWVAHAYEAAFCQQHYDPGTGAVYRDPVRALLRFAFSLRTWASMRPERLRMLARARALSLLCESRACPMLQAFCFMVLRETRGVRISEKFLFRTLGYYDFQRLLPALRDEPEEHEITLASRLHFQHLFGHPIEAQLEFERRVSRLRYLQPLPLAWLGLVSSSLVDNAVSRVFRDVRQEELFMETPALGGSKSHKAFVSPDPGPLRLYEAGDCGGPSNGCLLKRSFTCDGLAKAEQAARGQPPYTICSVARQAEQVRDPAQRVVDPPHSLPL